MKFAKELDDDLVPEWRSKYLNYKEGKKKIKAVSRALKEANRTPLSQALSASDPLPDDVPDSLPFTHYDFNRPTPRPAQTSRDQHGQSQDRPGGFQDRRLSLTMFSKSPPVLLPEPQPETESSQNVPARDPECIPLSQAQRGSFGQYGSFEGNSEELPGHMRNLELPDPAMTSSTSKNVHPPTENDKSRRTVSFSKDDTNLPKQPPGPLRKGSLAQRLFTRRNTDLGPPGHGTSRIFNKSKLRNMFHAHQLDSPYADNVQLEVYEKLDARQQEFFSFLDKEVKKVEDFYLMKEDEASNRLQQLRLQLHELRDRRLDEIQKSQGGPVEGEEGLLGGDIMNFPTIQKAVKENAQSNGHSLNPLKPISHLIAGKSSVGRTTKSLMQTTSPPSPANKRDDDNQDYVRRKPEAPSFRVAKRRLKLALQEFYRGLELLKSYTLLNRTAFRKINKKYDKAAKARPTLRYYSEKVEPAYFVKSDVIGGHIVAVEDLYARYFEKGNHKVAVNKLRTKSKRGDYSSTSFRNGLYLAAGVCFGISALTTALDRLFNPPSQAIFVETSYLLQLYGGYFLALLLFLIFCLDCRVWAANRINYQFIFEFDPRHTLDWRQLAELPCFFLFLNGVILWLNFRQSHGDAFYLYWPVVLVALTILIMALPFQILYYQARRWWGYSNWRVFFAGFYPVEFRDFYLGDMFCSITYTMAQIELFFCLYVNQWSNPRQCNSNHSRLLGFFTTLPAIWRALQCLRRYKDSGKWFPHLANFAKYCGNILYYMSLSVYRIDMNGKTKAVFLVFAIINGLYCSFWDVSLDWSLGSPFSKNFLLRDRLAYRQKRLYYIAIPLDIILRHQWICYALYTEDLQHSSAVSFFVGLAEVLRRGMWSLFRVENEHCNNVGNFRASRDIPLPYKLAEEEDEDRSPTDEEHTPRTPSQAAALSATGADLEQAPTESTTTSLRQRKSAGQTPTFRALQRVGTALAGAHAMDFEKKRKLPGQSSDHDDDHVDEQGSSDEDEDDDEQMHQREDTADILEASKMVRRAAKGP